MSFTSYVARAIQLDALEIDRQFIDTIILHLDRSLNSRTASKFLPELRLLIEIYLWFKKQYQYDTSIGLDLFKLRFYSTQFQDHKKLSLTQKYSFLLPVAFSYLQCKLFTRVGLGPQWDKLLAYLQACQVINSLIFIYNGKYRTLAERLFRVQVGRDSSQGGMFNHSYLFLNRELIWNALIEVFALFLPIVIYNPSFRSMVSVVTSYFEHKSKSVVDSQINAPSKCQICGDLAINARTFSNCRHIYCYFCIATQLIDHQQYHCKLCETTVESATQLRNHFR